MTTDPTVPARAGLYAALADLQAKYTATTTLADALALMPVYGLSWFVKDSARSDVELRLCHSSGGDLAVLIDSEAPLKLYLESLIGLRSVVFPLASKPAPVAPPAPEPEPVAPSAPGPDAIEAAAESLAAATAGQVIPEPTTEPVPSILMLTV